MPLIFAPSSVFNWFCERQSLPSCSCAARANACRINARSTADTLSLFFLRACASAEYKTVRAVQGPLVILDKVKVITPPPLPPPLPHTRHLFLWMSLGAIPRSHAVFRVLSAPTQSNGYSSLFRASAPRVGVQSLTVGAVQLPKFAEIVTLRLGNGEMKRGQVLEISGQKAVVQVRAR